MSKITAKSQKYIKTTKNNIKMINRVPLVFDEVFQRLPPFNASGGGVPLSEMFIPLHLQFYPVETFAEPIAESVHLHQRFVMIALREGEFRVDVSHQPQILHAGECLFIPPYSRHCVTDNFSRSFRAVFASFQLDAGQEKLGAIGERAIKLRVADWRILLRCMRNFLYACDGHMISGLATASEFGLFLETLYERIIQPPHTSVNAVNYYDTLVGKISRVICEDFRNRPSIDYIARRCNVSPSSVRQVFKKTMGVSIGKYICSKHLNIAIEQLKSSELSLGEIAMQTGYGSATALANAIRRECGLSPSKIRKESSGG